MKTDYRKITESPADGLFISMFVLFLAIFSTNAQIGKDTKTIKIPDPKFEKFLVDKKYDADGKVNGVCQYFDTDKATSYGFKNVLKVTSINLYDDDDIPVDNLKGIEIFTELTNLYCGDSLSNKMEYIDLSKNTKIRILNLNSGYLKNVDLRKNTDLVELNCAHNNIEGLDLRNGNNNNLNIKNSDFRGNKELKCILVDNKKYSDANWSDIKDKTASYVEDEAGCRKALSVDDFVKRNNEIKIFVNSRIVNTFSVSVPMGEKLEKVEVTDLLGRILLSSKNKKNYRIASPNLYGYYLIKIKTDKRTEIKKVSVK